MIELFNRIVGRRNGLRLETSRIATYEQYLKYTGRMGDEYKLRRQIERDLISSDSSFTVRGYCFVCRKMENLQVDFSYSYPINGEFLPNWREHLQCPSCKLNNRMRAAIHLLDQECSVHLGSRIYITEQSTPLFQVIRAKYPYSIGSEYLGSMSPLGEVDKNGLRNESIANLTFPANSFDQIVSFDVLEHVPNYARGFGECFRCLKPGGTLLFSVPFFPTRPDTIVRARMEPDGTICHLLPPEYHGDPLNAKGCLCFYHFGWDLLGVLEQLGFQDSYALFYWSRQYGYIGNSDQSIFIAKKGNGLKGQ